MTVSQNWLISRRRMLQGVGAAVGLPLLDVMQPLRPAGAAAPEKTKRICYMYFPNGVGSGAWEPERVSDDGKLLKLNEWMKPLDAFKSDITIPQNMWTPHGNGHGAGTATWLTGHSYDERKIDAGGLSVDQLAAQKIGDQTLLSSLELSLRGEGYFSNSLVRNCISWTSSSTPAPRDLEPRVVFDRMFRRGDSGISDKSVLDQIVDDAKSLKLRVSNEDRRKLDEYLDSLRVIERRIAFADRQAERLAKNPNFKSGLKRPTAGIPADHGEYMRLMMDVIVMAFWSDATRVCTLMLDHGQSNRYFNFIDGVQGTWHALSHWRDFSGSTEDDDGKTRWNSRDEKLKMYQRVTQWHHEQFAYFLGRLKAIREGDGTLLDNSLTLYGSSLADGHEHEAKNLPLILAGRGGGSVEAGRALQYRRPTTMSNLHLTMLQSVGAKVNKFGDSTGTI
jgi:hypothetical protein